ncbi:hypothetical protein [Microbispora sp. H10830]|uniref:hypothetical protein n=1 Tax=Microbispora sp. H10830 TaxID=2729109 RepID=UPI001602B7C7|nr:hypothetical protein [Microbispora sp. H10830]
MPAGGALMWAAKAAAAGRTWLILGVVLHQSAGSPPATGLQVALDRSRRLIDAVRESLDSVVAAQGVSEQGRRTATASGTRPCEAGSAHHVC